MDKQNLINYWSYEKPIESLKIHDVLSKKLCNFYSELNNVELLNLNLLNESFNHYYWYICKKTGILYYINLIIDNKEFQLTKEIIPALSEVNRYVFKQINFELLNTNDSLSSINKFEITSEDIKNLKETLTYNLINLTIEDKSVLDINKPSRSMRYLRRQILFETNKRSYSDDIQVKKSKKNTDNNIWNEMISATSVRNYMLNDPLIDWLKEYKIHDLEDIPSKISDSRAIIKSNLNPDPFTKCIMDGGNEFEEELINILNKNHKIVKVGDHISSRLKEKFEETIDLMKKGENIIYQAVLHNYDDKTFGMPDLLVRSDYINKLMGYEVVNYFEAKLGSQKLQVPWHYKVIDIKHSNIPLRADGIHILNSESIKTYKGQLYIYTRDLNKVQGISINKAYIWGKKYNWESKGIKYENNKFLSKLGVIDYDSVDSEKINQSKNAIEWIQTLKNEGSNWSLLPLPSRKELFPNMKNQKDGEHRKLKNKLSKETKEITSVYYCGVKKREKAHLQKIFKWTDPKCNSKVLEFNKNGKIANRVDCILDINRQTKDIIRPSFINWDRENWKTKDQECIEFYLDFETLNSNFGSIIKEGIISYDNNQFIFMIGVGYENNGNWIYKTFVMKEKHENFELSMFQDFHKYISIVMNEFNKKKAKFYHWSPAEPTAYNNFKKRHIENSFYDMNFYDLIKVFQNEPIVVNGALNFSLKTIAKALYNHNMIKSSWDSSSLCSNGLNAMILANEIYEKVNNKTISNPLDYPIMKEIIKYNEIDCKVMWEIHNLIREKF